MDRLTLAGRPLSSGVDRGDPPGERNPVGAAQLDAVSGPEVRRPADDADSEQAAPPTTARLAPSSTVIVASIRLPKRSQSL